MTAIAHYVEARSDEELEELAQQYETLEESAKLGDCEFRELVEGLYARSHFATGSLVCGLHIYRELAQRRGAERDALIECGGHT